MLKCSSNLSPFQTPSQAETKVGLLVIYPNCGCGRSIMFMKKGHLLSTLVEMDNYFSGAFSLYFLLTLIPWIPRISEFKPSHKHRHSDRAMYLYQYNRLEELGLTAWIRKTQSALIFHYTLNFHWIVIVCLMSNPNSGRLVDEAWVGGGRLKDLDHPKTVKKVN